MPTSEMSIFNWSKNFVLTLQDLAYLCDLIADEPTPSKKTH